MEDIERGACRLIDIRHSYTYTIYIYHMHIILRGGLSVTVRIFVEVFLNAKIVQIESRISSSLEYYAEMQPILCKDTSF